MVELAAFLLIIVLLVRYWKIWLFLFLVMVFLSVMAAQVEASFSETANPLVHEIVPRGTHDCMLTSGHKICTISGMRGLCPR